MKLDAHAEILVVVICAIFFVSLTATGECYAPRQLRVS
jgi:hypothetical protein